MSYMDYPYRIDLDRRTAQTGGDEHIRDLIEQVLFTSPGERVNRPTFGSGLLQLIFAGQDDELSHATQALVQGALQQWLGDLIQIEAIQVESVEAQINVTIQYTVRRSQRRETAQFTRRM
jgi:phage baseplate assembly protein W